MHCEYNTSFAVQDDSNELIVRHEETTYDHGDLELVRCSRAVVFANYDHIYSGVKDVRHEIITMLLVSCE